MGYEFEAITLCNSFPGLVLIFRAVWTRAQLRGKSYPGTLVTEREVDSVIQDI